MSGEQPSNKTKLKKQNQLPRKEVEDLKDQLRTITSKLIDHEDQDGGQSTPKSSSVLSPSSIKSVDFMSNQYDSLITFKGQLQR